MSAAAEILRQFAALGVEPVGASDDSLLVRPGDLFLAYPGDAADGRVRNGFGLTFQLALFQLPGREISHPNPGNVVDRTAVEFVLVVVALATGFAVKTLGLLLVTTFLCLLDSGLHFPVATAPEHPAVTAGQGVDLPGV